MSEKAIENNKVSVIGKIVSGFTFSHEVFGEGFYVVDLEVNRLSDQADIIPLMISERLLNVSEDYIGCTVEAIGQFRSYNRHEGARNRLVLSVFVREINFASVGRAVGKTCHQRRAGSSRPTNAALFSQKWISLPLCDSSLTNPKSML